MPIRIELFGGIRLRLGDRVIDQFSPKQPAYVLACLAFHLREEPRRREDLIAQCWPLADEKHGRNSLSKALGMLHKLLEPEDNVLSSDQETVWLNRETTTTDVIEFESHVQAAFGNQPYQLKNPMISNDCAQHLNLAVELYHGDLLPDLDLYWVEEERPRLADLYFLALNRLIDHRIQTENYFSALQFAHRAIAHDPLEEKAHYSLMRVYVALDRPVAALKQFKELKRILWKELEIEPSASTRHYVQEILEWLKLDRIAASPPGFVQPSPDRALLTPLAGGRHTMLAIRLGELTQEIGDRADFAELAKLLGQAIHKNLGSLMHSECGLFIGKFSFADQALSCAMECQIAIASYGVEAWEDLSLRIAIHTDSDSSGTQDYEGAAVSIMKCIAATAPKGQIVCTHPTTEELVRHARGSNLSLVSLDVDPREGYSTSERVFIIEHPSQRQNSLSVRGTGHRTLLPVVRTRFIGRKDEIRHLRTTLLDSNTRLVTLKGPPGVGKSRLSQEVGRQLLDAFDGAVWFVPLGDVTEARRIAGEISDAIGLPPSPLIQPFEQVTEFLASQRCLLILDNMEQFADQGRILVKALVDRVPTLTCIVTSRISLAIPGEQVVQLSPLAIPLPESSLEAIATIESVLLFEDRAKAANPAFQVTRQNADSVAELCIRLEGIPLAIELVAGKAQILSPEQMLARMEERFDLLVTKKRDVEPRHRTFWAAIDSSYSLLPHEIRVFFARLSIFRGGWTAEAANVICGEGMPKEHYLEVLSECSLLSASSDNDSGDASTRFRVLESLREFGQNQLEEVEWRDLSRRHFEYFLGLAQEAKVGLTGLQQAYWLDRLEAEHDNLASCFQWAKENNAVAGLRLAASLPQFWDIHGHWSSGRRWLLDLLERCRDGDRELRARSYLAVGNFSKILGDYGAARDAYLQSLNLLVGLEADLLRSYVLNGLGILAQEQGDFTEARQRLEESLEIKRKLGDPVGKATALGNLGFCAYLQNDLTAARTYLVETVSILETVGVVGQVYANALNNLGGVSRLEGEFERAHVKLTKSLNLRLEIGDRKNLAYSLDEFARLADSMNEPKKATQLLAAAERQRMDLGFRLPPSEEARCKAFTTLLHADLGGDRFKAIWFRGKTLTIEQAIRLCLQSRAS